MDLIGSFFIGLFYDVNAKLDSALTKSSDRKKMGLFKFALIATIFYLFNI